MVPARMEQIEAVPLNANGKVDRSRIEVPDAAKFRAPYAPLRTEAEKRIAEVFEKILGVGNVGALDDFNLLGAIPFWPRRRRRRCPT